MLGPRVSQMTCQGAVSVVQIVALFTGEREGVFAWALLELATMAVTVVAVVVVLDLVFVISGKNKKLERQTHKIILCGWDRQLGRNNCLSTRSKRSQWGNETWTQQKFTRVEQWLERRHYWFIESGLLGWRNQKIQPTGAFHYAGDGGVPRGCSDCSIDWWSEKEDLIC